jgi:hypothetical protein
LYSTRIDSDFVAVMEAQDHFWSNSGLYYVLCAHVLLHRSFGGGVGITTVYFPTSSECVTLPNSDTFVYLAANFIRIKESHLILASLKS